MSPPWMGTAWFLLAGASLLFPLPIQSANPTSPVEEQEIKLCRRNLHLIFDAIQAYRRDQRDLPNSLMDLYPRFLSETRFLICPAARRLGVTSADVSGWGNPAKTTYGYEFKPETIPEIMSGGWPRTMREWKRLQMGLVGSEVPIVRCHTHEHAILNLAFSGRIYESQSIDWEGNFASVADMDELGKARLLTVHSIMKRIVIPGRDARATPAMIDLSDHYHKLVDELAPDLASLVPPNDLPRGMAKFNAVDYDVRGAIQLGALRPGLVHYPRAVLRIAIGPAARGVHLLVATAYAAAPGTAVADCVFHLSDGRNSRLRLRYGKHCLSLVAPPEEPWQLALQSKIAWSVRTSEGGTIRLCETYWVHPFPGQSIESMDFIGVDNHSGPFLVAMTLDQEP